MAGVPGLGAAKGHEEVDCGRGVGVSAHLPYDSGRIDLQGQQERFKPGRAEPSRAPVDEGGAQVARTTMLARLATRWRSPRRLFPCLGPGPYGTGPTVAADAGHTEA